MAVARLTKQHFDVAVVGAGPGGSSTAYFLARRGRRVLLLDKGAFPRDKACGDGLTVSSLDVLSEMGLSEALAPYQHVKGVRVQTGGREYRDFTYERVKTNKPALGVVVPRYELDFLLSRKAVEAGAVLWEKTAVNGPLFRNGRVCGLNLAEGSRAGQVTADFVVAAVGGSSTFRAKAGFPEPDRWSTGFALRGYFSLAAPLPDFFQVHLPLRVPVSGRNIAGYGWAFPVNASLANIGVGFFPSSSEDFSLNLRDLFDQFIEDLQQKDARFSRMTLTGRLRGGPLPCGMDPSHSHHRGVLLAGDAAGLVDPFTGEGINAALESGKMAAAVLDAAINKTRRSDADLAEYSRLLEERFRERFHAGRRFVKTYSFLWNVIEKTFHMDNPLFDGLRQAAIDYGPNETGWLNAALRENSALVDALDLQEEFQHVADRFNTVLAAQNPLFPKIARVMLDRRGAFLRLALLFLCGRCGPADRIGEKVEAAVAVELCNLAMEVHDTVFDEDLQAARRPHPFSSSQVNWANMFGVMAGNYLLVEAYRIFAGMDAELSREASRTCVQVCSGKLRRIEWVRRGGLDEMARLESAGATAGSLFQLCCWLGAKLGSADPSLIAPLTAFGRNLGVAHQLGREASQAESAAAGGHIPAHVTTANGRTHGTPTVRNETQRSDHAVRLASINEATWDALTALGNATGNPISPSAQLILANAGQFLAAIPTQPARDALVRLISAV